MFIQCQLGPTHTQQLDKGHKMVAKNWHKKYQNLQANWEYGEWRERNKGKRSIFKRHVAPPAAEEDEAGQEWICWMVGRFHQENQLESRLTRREVFPPLSLSSSPVSSISPPHISSSPHPSSSSPPLCFGRSAGGWEGQGDKLPRSQKKLKKTQKYFFLF